MITVWFDGARGSRIIGISSTYREANEVVDDFLEEAKRKNGFTRYYTRINYIDGEKTIWMDVGSHTEFFRIVFDRWDEYVQAKDLLCCKSQ